ncbi:response regulator [candidate division GN15 bacterium]|nr:response regulator [candidate division GN15 bacterium]
MNALSNNGSSNKPKPVILVVDDEEPVLNTLVDLLGDRYTVLTATDAESSILLAKSHAEIATVVMDIKMAGTDGITAARELHDILPDVPIIFHTGYPGEYQESEIDQSEQPFDYIQKGKSIPELLRTVRNAVESYGLRSDNRSLMTIAEQSYRMYGRSKVMQEVFRKIHRVAPSDAKVIVFGESGTGKELVARAIRASSKRKEQRMAILNCNHKSPYLIEAELFGNTKGAFTGATHDRIGLFEYADGGTVFLDEIGDLDITTQGKLLRVIEEGEYVKLGSPEVRTSDVRVLCATHRDLEALVEQGKFRQDLYYRLAGITITLPPLRERKEDIPLLVEKFASQLTVEQGRPPKIFDRSALQAMLEFDWPGNVRQLVDTVESLIVLCESDIIFERDVRDFLNTTPTMPKSAPRKLSERLRLIERELIIGALVEADYNISAAARLLEHDRANLQKKIKAHDIDIRSLKQR